MTIWEAVKEGEKFLAAKQIEDAAIDAWYLMEYVLKEAGEREVDRTWYLLNRNCTLEEPAVLRYRELLKKRGAHIPLQHITGQQEFMGFPFRVNEHVLIPRQDTELLVEEALQVLKPGMQVLDLCTGSGCIIISLMKCREQLTGMAADISEEALEVARENAKLLHAEVTFVQGDLFEPVQGSYDVIVSNPPYIPTKEIEKLTEEVRLHDPMKALDGKEDGLYFYRRIVKEAIPFLKENGWLMMEIGHDQGAAVSEWMRDAGYAQVSVVKDLAGLDRVVKGYRRKKDV